MAQKSRKEWKEPRQQRENCGKFRFLSSGGFYMSDRFSGFDTSQYPGDPALQTWKTQSPYKFVGYYLKSPRHRNASWSGKRSTLKNMGWGTAVVYVGRQAEGQGAGGTISASVGQTDGGDAIAKCKAE